MHINQYVTLANELARQSSKFFLICLLCLILAVLNSACILMLSKKSLKILAVILLLENFFISIVVLVCYAIISLLMDASLIVITAFKPINIFFFISFLTCLILCFASSCIWFYYFIVKPNAKGGQKP